MRAQSNTTAVADPYRAGLALGESLATFSPEVVFLFSSVHYAVPELLEGLYDGMDSDRVIVVGNSGDGLYETSGTADQGAAVLALSSDGQIRWCLERICGVKEALPDKLRGLIGLLKEGGESPTLAYLVSDFRADASQIEAALGEVADFPVVGGFAGDDHRMVASYVYANRALLTDALVVLAAYGPLRFSIAVGNSLQIVGSTGVIEAAEGTQIDRIDGLTAVGFIERETGKPVLQTDRGVLCLAVDDPARNDERRLRSIVPDFSQRSGSVGLFGGVSRGHRVQVCRAQPDDLTAEIYAIVNDAAASGLSPAAALVVSCSGRKALLGGHIGHEVGALSNAFPQLPLAGFPSFGEIAPLRDGSGYTRNLFHNMTYVLLLIER